MALKGFQIVYNDGFNTGHLWIVRMSMQA